MSCYDELTTTVTQCSYVNLTTSLQLFGTLTNTKKFGIGKERN